jgi:sulfopyruvate decarboxylase TPP-binding subunit
MVKIASAVGAACEQKGEKRLAGPQHKSHTRPTWPNLIHAILKRNGISQVGYVPDTGHAQLISLCQADNEITDVVLTTEAEGPALLKNCAVPIVILVTMRGEFNDFNPWQVPMGSITEPTLKLCGFLTYRIEREEDIEDVLASGCKMAFGGGNLQVAILLSQRMLDRYKPEGH